MMALCAGLSLAAPPILAQSPGADAGALARARSDAAQARRRSAALERAAAEAVAAAAQARVQEAAITGRIAAAETDIATAEERMRIVAVQRVRQRARLAAQQGPIVRLAAGLQVMARRPPALALVQRGSVADLIHVRALLAGQRPLVARRTAALRRDVAEGIRLQRQADAAAAALRDGRHRLTTQRIALAQLEARERIRAQGYTDDAMREEDRATAFGEDARDILDRMGRAGTDAEIGRRLAALPGPMPRPPIPGFPAPPLFSGLLAARPALAYRLPVTGRLVTGLGEVSEAGVRARGLTIAPAPAAPVGAPSGGRVVFAGPFRGYGYIVIIDHGGGWTSLVTNLARIGVATGDRIAIAAPIGRAATVRPLVTVELRRRGQAVNIIPLVAAG